MIAPAQLREFLRFCIVGFIGFLLDAALLELFVTAGLPAPLARMISMPSALQLTYVLHSRFTFPAPFSFRAWLKFMIANSTGALVNYFTFLLSFWLLPMPNALLQRQAALAVGTMVGLFFNYWANRRFVFKAGNHDA